MTMTETELKAQFDNAKATLLASVDALASLEQTVTLALFPPVEPPPVDPPPVPLPTIEISVLPLSGVAPLTVECVYSGEGADNVTWEFGDGQTASGATVTHIYTEPATTYMVVCKAYNATGFVMRTQAVSVAMPEPPPVPDDGHAFRYDYSTLFSDPITGNLNPEQVYVARCGQLVNPNGAGKNTWVGAIQMYCLEMRENILPPQDIVICGEQFGEADHYMTSIRCPANLYFKTDVIYLQPAGFPTDGTPLVFKFGVDAKTFGMHDGWPGFALTESLDPCTHMEHPAFRTYPRNGIEIEFNKADATGDWVGKRNAVGTITVWRNGVSVPVSRLSVPGSDTFLTEEDVNNLFEVRLAAGALEVWASDAGQTAMRLVAAVTIPGGIPFQTCHVHQYHSMYGPAKDNPDHTRADRTYHWRGMEWNGPKLPPVKLLRYPNGSKMVDSSLVMPGGWGSSIGMDLGYLVPPAAIGRKFAFPASAAPTRLIFNAFCSNASPWTIDCNGTAISVPAPLSGFAWVIVEVPLPAAPEGYNLTMKPPANMVVSNLMLAA